MGNCLVHHPYFCRPADIFHPGTLRPMALRVRSHPDFLNLSFRFHPVDNTPGPLAVSVASSLPTGAWPWPSTLRKRSGSVWRRGSRCFVSAITSAHCTPRRFNSVTPLSFRTHSGVWPCGRGAPKSVCFRNGSKRRRHRFVLRPGQSYFDHHSLFYH